MTQAKQSAKLTYDEFVKQYEPSINHLNVPIEVSKQLEKQYPKFAAKWRLLTGFGALNVGSTVYVLIRKRSRTGYSKSISLYTIGITTDGKFRLAQLTTNVGTLLGYNSHNYEGSWIIRVDDYPQEFVCHLSQALFGVDNASALSCEVL